MKSREELRQEEAERKLEEIKEAERSQRFAAEEIRRLYAEFARQYPDTPRGRTIEGWLKSTESKAVEPKVAEAPKPDPPKPPEPAPVEAIAKSPLPALPGPAVPPSRAAVPDAALQRDAEAALRKTFSVDRAKTPREKADLARTLLQAAATSGAKNAERYVMLRDARDLAAQGMDVKTAIDASVAAFDVEGLGEKVDLLAKTTVKGPAATAWGVACLDLAEEASEADQYEAAVKLAGRAEALARAANDRSLEATAKERGKELADLKRVADGIKAHFRTLESKPDDPAANAAVGKFAGLVKGDWKRGLPMLAKGSEPALKSLAEQELGKPTDAAAQAALGEAWAAQAEKETPTYKIRARGRAAEWLGRAIPGLTGLVKVSAEKKLAALGPIGSKDRLLTLDLGGGVRMELVYVKPGIFTMGGTQAPTSDWRPARQGTRHRLRASAGGWRRETRTS